MDGPIWQQRRRFRRGRLLMWPMRGWYTLSIRQKSWKDRHRQFALSNRGHGDKSVVIPKPVYWSRDYGTCITRNYYNLRYLSLICKYAYLFRQFRNVVGWPNALGKGYDCFGEQNHGSSLPELQGGGTIAICSGVETCILVLKCEMQRFASQTPMLHYL